MVPDILVVQTVREGTLRRRVRWEVKQLWQYIIHSCLTSLCREEMCVTVLEKEDVVWWGAYVDRTRLKVNDCYNVDL